MRDGGKVTMIQRRCRVPGCGVEVRGANPNAAFDALRQHRLSAHPGVPSLGDERQLALWG